MPNVKRNRELLWRHKQKNICMERIECEVDMKLDERIGIIRINKLTIIGVYLTYFNESQDKLISQRKQSWPN